MQKPQKTYSLFEAGELENKIAGRVADPLGILMVLSDRMWTEFYKGTDESIGAAFQDIVDDFYDADAAINDDNIKVRSLKRVRVWMDAVVSAFVWIETNIADPVSCGIAECKILGSAAQPLGTIAAWSGWLWHDTCKAVATIIGAPLRDSVDSYYAKDKAITDKNAKVKAMKRIRAWLDVVIDAVEYIEARTNAEDFSKPKTRG